MKTIINAYKKISEDTKLLILGSFLLLDIIAIIISVIKGAVHHSEIKEIFEMMVRYTHYSTVPAGIGIGIQVMKYMIGYSSNDATINKIIKMAVVLLSSIATSMVTGIVVVIAIMEEKFGILKGLADAVRGLIRKDGQ